MQPMEENCVTDERNSGLGTLGKLFTEHVFVGPDQGGQVQNGLGKLAKWLPISPAMNSSPSLAISWSFAESFVDNNAAAFIRSTPRIHPWHLDS